MVPFGLCKMWLATNQSFVNIVKACQIYWTWHDITQNLGRHESIASPTLIQRKAKLILEAVFLLPNDIDVSYLK